MKRERPGNIQEEKGRRFLGAIPLSHQTYPSLSVTPLSAKTYTPPDVTSPGPAERGSEEHRQRTKWENGEQRSGYQSQQQTYEREGKESERETSSLARLADIGKSART
ncbi:MAG: hypothetical protein GY696_00085 [Gammaproteobacteria bacterium]|nr:hypothetical protein [Gammaproteobacteria bacterium]